MDIERNNKKIIKDYATTHDNHEYFNKKYFSQAEALFKQLDQELKQKLKQRTLELETGAQQHADYQQSTGHTIYEPTKIVAQQEQDVLARKLDAKKQIIKTNLQNLLVKMEEKKSKAYYTQKITLLSKYWESFAETFEDVVSKTTKENQNFNETLEEFTYLEAEYQDVIIQLQEKLDLIIQQPMNNNENKLDVRLPRLEIPHFYGDISKWVSFHDIFDKMINKNQGLTNTHKINYLKAHIGGAAAKLINHLPCSEENYDAAWNILMSRYNNKRLQISTQLNTLLGQTSLTTESARGIKTLHDTIIESMHAIENQGIDTSSWDPIIVHIMTKKLDNETLRLYEVSITNSKELQPLKGFLEFLERRFSSLDAMQNQKSVRNNNQGNFGGKQYLKSMHLTGTSIKCRVCEGKHFISSCPQFRKMSNVERNHIINKTNSCRKCFSTKHELNDCKSTIKCNICNGMHNTLLHQSMPQRSTNTAFNQQQMKANEASNVQIQTTTVNQSMSRSNVILGTALVKAIAHNGREELLRILIDTGSQATFITEEASEKLRLRRKPMYTEIAGMGGINSGIARSKVNLTIQPRFPSKFSLEIEALVFKQLTKDLPDGNIEAWKWKHINNLLWADPNFCETGRIDILLGANYYTDIILSEIAKGGRGEPVAQRTELGWVIFGSANTSIDSNNITTLISSVNIEKQLQRFWELEEIQTEKEQTQEEHECEDLFQRTYKRNTDGTYTVNIPFKVNSQQLLGDSKRRAVARLLQVEKRLKNDPEMHKQYHTFMKEYLTLNHMKEVKKCDLYQEKKVYYLPHHAVFKENSATTKLRVVFDASAKTSTGVSLNDQMHTGPRLQQNLDTIVLRWRKYKCVFTADIEKMYRQIKIADEDQSYQRILWRVSRDDPIREFQLTTVTYGTASAPYLAVKILQQLAKDEQITYPRASKTVLSDFYVDDLMSGADSIIEAKELQSEIIQLLKSGGFNLRKWMSNSEAILQSIPEGLRAFNSLHIKDNDTVKALGIHWNPLTDTFEYKVDLPASSTETMTKRKLLSEASKLFDPLGLLAPTIIKAKIMFQQLWLTKLSWDDPLPIDLDSHWKDYAKDLQNLEKIRIPRWINYTSSTTIELHGFCDSSEQAYAACVYSRTTTNDGKVKTTLLTAKTKVAPIKSKLSLPRLELCGALLLARLMHQVQETIQMHEVTTYAWCDSTIVLAWIKGSNHKFKTFVANRISKIQTLMPSTTWFHVRSKENPADCASRGITPSQLCTHSLWWTGPEWLKLSREKWAIEEIQIPLSEDPEVKKVAITSMIISSPFLNLFERISKISKLQRIMAYVHRFINNSRKGHKETSTTITPLELKTALVHIVRIVQGSEFQEEIMHLNTNQNLSRKSKILSLNPYLDGSNLLRVGGRLQNSSLPYEEKHPIILPQGHLITRMIVEEAHLRTMHGGAQLTLAYIRKRFWIINGRSCVRHIIRKCIKCFRFNVEVSKQLMGSLPEARVTPSRPFIRTGVDYAGPLQIRTTKGRGQKSYKGYLAIFVCLSTKAIHIEIVSDQTTQAFIAAYKRFTSRRGLCVDIYSDNGTNFVGANNKLLRNHKETSCESNKEIAEILSADGTNWHFIPPTAPHFGGIWEAGVKSIKYHLKRVIGDTTLTFEELSTVTCEIEACLNSRPLAPMSNDHTDLAILTPGHFLIGDALKAPPQPTLEDTNTTSITRWKLVEKIRQDFWKRWSQDYLHSLQQRAKWLTASKNTRIGELVLIKDDKIPPSKWVMGRIIDTHPGSDGKVRVVTIQGPGKILIKRPITKIAPLPITDASESSIDTTDPVTTATINLCITKEVLTTKVPTTSKRKIDPPAMDNKRIKEENEGQLSPQSENQKIAARQWMRGQHTEKPQALAKQLQTKIHRPQKKRVTIHPCLGASALLYTTTILCILFQPASAQGLKPFEIKPFITPPGLYFDHIGHVNFVNHEWNIIIYYNLTIFWDELKQFKQCIKHMRLICQATSEARLSEDICIVFLNQLQAHLVDIENADMFIKDSNKDTHPRNKRGAINGIGYIANELFGILDQRAAEKYENDIKQINQNELHLLDLMKNQTSITNASVKLFKANEEALQKQMSLFNTHMQLLENHLNTVNKIAAQQNITDSVLIITLHATLIMIRYQQTQNILIEMITHTHQGKIHPLLLTPAQLKAELNIINTHLPEATTIPGTPTGGMIQLYNLMTVKMRLTEENIIFCVKLPLQGTEKFQLFRPVPIPIMHQTKSVIIKPNSEYLLVNSHRDRYYPMKETELRTCTHAYNQQYLCKPHQVIYGAKSNESKCEMDFLTHKVNPLTSCILNTVLSQKKWIPLSQPNSWIYVMDKEGMIDIICEGKITHTKLIGDGIIHLQPACSIQQEGMLVTTQDKHSHAISMSFLPTIQLNNSITLELHKLELPPTISFNFSKNWTELQQTINNHENNLRLVTSLNKHDIHHYISIYVVVALIFIILIGFIRYKYYNQHKKEAAPASQSTETEQPSGSRTSSLQIPTFCHPKSGAFRLI